jgi:uncharacterized membrane protein YesL
VCARGSDLGLLCGPSTQPLDVAVARSVPALGTFARAFVAINRLFGAFALVGGISLLAKCAWHLLQGVRDWSHSYFAVLFGVTLTLVGIVYLRAPLWRQRSQDSVR